MGCSTNCIQHLESRCKTPTDTQSDLKIKFIIQVSVCVTEILPSFHNITLVEIMLALNVMCLDTCCLCFKCFMLYVY
jgi:hypothetical protein